MNPAAHQPIDLDQVASKLDQCRAAWARQGLTAGELTWRDARAPWPQAIVADRALVTEPESLGVILTAVGGREGDLIIWRGGWADVHLLTGEEVTTKAPGLRDVADCVALAESLARQLTTTRSSETWDRT